MGVGVAVGDELLSRVAARHAALAKVWPSTQKDAEPESNAKHNGAHAQRHFDVFQPHRAPQSSGLLAKAEGRHIGAVKILNRPLDTRRSKS